MNQPENHPSTANRWWIYQRERFPVIAHGILIAAFSSCAVLYAAQLTHTRPAPAAFLAAFITSFLYFLQLRIADEFKDFEEDARYRPYRPVPRGLVKLSELHSLFIFTAAIQLVVTLALHPPLIIFLLITWAYLTLMSVEFFARDWLKRRPITYLWTHMLIMPLVDLHATAFQWMPDPGVTEKPIVGLAFFLIASFFNGIVIEVGRKLRQPAEEEPGVPTYSKLWGQRTAATVWLACIFATTTFAALAATRIDHLNFVLGILAVPLILAIILATRFRQTTAKTYETASGIWTILLYLSLGILSYL